MARAEPGLFPATIVALLQIFADQAVIAIENGRLFKELGARNAELSETLAQQTATGDILRVISSSPTDIQPVFDAIVEHAGRLCRGIHTIAVRLDGDTIVLVAHHAPSADAREQLSRVFPRPLGAGSGAMRRVLVEGQVVHEPDIDAHVNYPEASREAARIWGYRARLIVPMLLEGRPIGAIAVGRPQAGAFSDQEIALLQTFAGQAVIAIENVRLFKELEARNADLTEGLSRETATGEILRVIAGSPTQIQPVLDAVVARAALVCAAHDAVLYRAEGDDLEIVAHVGPIRAPLGFRFPLDRGTISGRAFLDRASVHVHDLAAEHAEFPRGIEFARMQGTRTCLAVPLLRQGTVLGVLTIRRDEVHAFSDKQIALLQTFADQAVIAIENVRLFHEIQQRNAELRETLEHQTATADVLRIIAESPTELQPVLDAIAASAVRLCEASDAVIERLEGDRFYNAAHAGAQMKGLVGLPLPLTRQFPGGRAVLDRQRVIVDDIHLVAATEYPDTLELLKLNTIYSVAEIPLLSKGQPLGSLAVLRAEVRPFTDTEVALLETFADQAVIAIENVRLFKELQARNAELTESLEQQTATAEILRAISESTMDVQPVFEVIAENAARFCGADRRAESGAWRGSLSARSRSPWARRPTTDADWRERSQLSPRSRPGAWFLIGTRSTSRTSRRAETEFPETHGTRAARSCPGPVRRWPRRCCAKACPLASSASRQGGRAALHRPSKSSCWRSFAAQAVIAIENVRLFTELEARNRELTEALEQQTATAEILRVISSSPTDVQPVFETIAQSAARLCEATHSILFRFEGELLTIAATYNFSLEEIEAVVTDFPRRAGREFAGGRAVLERAVVHIADVEDDAEYRMRAQKRLRYRSILGVPMLRDGVPIGAVAIWRERFGRSPRRRSRW